MLHALNIIPLCRCKLSCSFHMGAVGQTLDVSNFPKSLHIDTIFKPSRGVFVPAGFQPLHLEPINSIDDPSYKLFSPSRQDR